MQVAQNGREQHLVKLGLITGSSMKHYGSGALSHEDAFDSAAWEE